MKLKLARLRRYIREGYRLSGFTVQSREKKPLEMDVASGLFKNFEGFYPVHDSNQPSSQIHL